MLYWYPRCHLLRKFVVLLREDGGGGDFYHRCHWLCCCGLRRRCCYPTMPHHHCLCCLLCSLCCFSSYLPILLCFGYHHLLCFSCYLSFFLCFGYDSLFCFLFFACLGTLSTLLLLDPSVFHHSLSCSRTDGSSILDLLSVGFLAGLSSCFCCFCMVKFLLENDILRCIDDRCF